jgi:hypothetical protein
VVLLDRDQFSHDPQVRFLRHAFAGMEETQDNLLKDMNVSPFDNRLRHMREMALNLFEKVWMVYNRWGASIDEQEMTDIYVCCLAHILDSQRIKVPAELLPANEKIEKLIKEVMK